MVFSSTHTHIHTQTHPHTHTPTHTRTHTLTHAHTKDHNHTAAHRLILKRWRFGLYLSPRHLTPLHSPPHFKDYITDSQTQSAILLWAATAPRSWLWHSITRSELWPHTVTAWPLPMLFTPLGGKDAGTAVYVPRQAEIPQFAMQGSTWGSVPDCDRAADRCSPCVYTHLVLRAQLGPQNKMQLPVWHMDHFLS